MFIFPSEVVGFFLFFFVRTITPELLNHLKPNFVCWCIIVSWDVIQEDGIVTSGSRSQDTAKNLLLAPSSLNFFF